MRPLGTLRKIRTLCVFLFSSCHCAGGRPLSRKTASCVTALQVIAAPAEQHAVPDDPTWRLGNRLAPQHCVINAAASDQRPLLGQAVYNGRTCPIMQWHNLPDPITSPCARAISAMSLATDVKSFQNIFGFREGFCPPLVIDFVAGHGIAASVLESPFPWWGISSRW